MCKDVGMRKFLGKIADFVMKCARNIFELLFPRDPLVLEMKQLTAAELLGRFPVAVFDPYAARAGAPIPLFNYKNTYVKTAIWQIKYKKNTVIAEKLAQILHGKIMEILKSHKLKKPLLIPMPISAERRRERGYNQCELLAQHLWRLQGDEYEVVFTALRKIKDTPKQSRSAGRTARLQNIQGCFEADPRVMSGRDVIILDDVVTTGTTLNEAGKAVRMAGASGVVKIAVAG